MGERAVDIVFRFIWLQPDLDELRRWLKGEGITMPLSDEERERLREIESIRAEVQQESLRQRGPFLGPVVGDCRACARPLYANWRYCPFCGEASAASCTRCHGPLPTMEGVQFCPQCGDRV